MDRVEESMRVATCHQNPPNPCMSCLGWLGKLEEQLQDILILHSTAMLGMETRATACIFAQTACLHLCRASCRGGCWSSPRRSP